jgi:hypothetical protein
MAELSSDYRDYVMQERFAHPDLRTPCLAEDQVQHTLCPLWRCMAYGQLYLQDNCEENPSVTSHTGSPVCHHLPQSKVMRNQPHPRMALSSFVILSHTAVKRVGLGDCL